MHQWVSLLLSWKYLNEASRNITAGEFTSQHIVTAVLHLQHLLNWTCGSAVAVHGQPIPAESVCSRWRQCTKYAMQPVWGLFLLELLSVHHAAMESSNVVTYKELKWDRVLKITRSVHCSHCVCFSCCVFDHMFLHCHSLFWSLIN